MMRFKQMAALFNARHERERLMITLGALVFVFLVWIFLFYMPIAHKIKSNSEKITIIKKNVLDLKAIYAKDELIIQSPTREMEEKKLSLEKLLIAVQKDILLTKKMIDSSDDYRAVLQAIAQVPEALCLNQLQDLPSTNVAGDKKISITFSGGYFETVTYLHYLEQLPWYLSFDHIDYTVEEYPNAKVTVVVTLLRTPEGIRHD